VVRVVVAVRRLGNQAVEQGNTAAGLWHADGGTNIRRGTDFVQSSILRAVVGHTNDLPDTAQIPAPARPCVHQQFGVINTHLHVVPSRSIIVIARVKVHSAHEFAAVL